MKNDLNWLTFSLRESGDGYELFDPDGEIIAWTMDRKWALRILLGLRLLNEQCCPENAERRP